VRGDTGPSSSPEAPRSTPSFRRPWGIRRDRAGTMLPRDPSPVGWGQSSDEGIDDVALTDVRPAAPAAGSRPVRELHFLANPWLMLLAVGGALLAYGWVFLVHPTLVAPTRDPAWYTWRANLLLHAKPDSIVRDWGPFGMFSGGYRVATPVI